MSSATAVSEALRSAESAAACSFVATHIADEVNMTVGLRIAGYKLAGTDTRKLGGISHHSRRWREGYSRQLWRQSFRFWDCSLAWIRTPAWGGSLAGLRRLGSLRILHESDPKLHDAERGLEMVLEEGRNNLVADMGCLGGMVGCCYCCCWRVVRRF